MSYREWVASKAFLLALICWIPRNSISSLAAIVRIAAIDLLTAPDIRAGDAPAAANSLRRAI